MWKNILKMLLPQSVRSKLRGLEKYIRYTSRRIILTYPVWKNKPIKIIVGAALTHQKGWYSTNEQWLDITSENHWEKIFKGKALITHVVAEHVFEHLTPEESKKALALIAKHMMPGGHIRIAVPDGYHPNPEYIKYIDINGIGADASDHKQLLTVDSLSSLLRNAGSAAGTSDEGWHFIDANTSLIIDGIKIS